MHEPFHVNSQNYTLFEFWNIGVFLFGCYFIPEFQNLDWSNEQGILNQ